MIENTKTISELLINTSSVLAGFFFTAVSIIFAISHSFLGRHLIKEGEFDKLFRSMLMIVGCFAIVILLSTLTLFWPASFGFAIGGFIIAMVLFIVYLYRFGKIMSAFIRNEQERLKNEEAIERSKIASADFFHENEKQKKSEGV